MMQTTKLARILSLILCMVLFVAMTLSAAGCGEDPSAAGTFTDGATLGEGAASFTFIVTDKDAKSVSCTVKTDAATVGDALSALGLIAGENGAYGLYVKTVNGITADYDVDQTYWAFYIGGEYASTGVDSTPVTDGAVYEFKVES